MRIPTICVSFILLTLATFGQGLFNSEEEKEEKALEYTGYTRASIAGGSEKYDISTAFAELAIKPKINKKNAFLYADLRFREAYIFDQHITSFDPKEIYVGYKSEYADVIMGSQIITWGRADGFNPTNNITPNNYFFISPEPDDQKMSNLMLRTVFRFSPETELEIIGIPFYKSSVYRYDLFLEEQNVHFNELNFSEKGLNQVSYAARLNFEYPAAGFSVSYYSGYSTFYGFDILSMTWNADETLSIENIGKTYKQQTIGADFAIPVKSVVLRGEAAYNRPNDYKDSVFIPNPDIALVGGIEINILETSAILQYVGKYTTDYQKLSEPILSNPLDQVEQMIYAENMVRYETALFNRKVFDQQEETNHALVLTLSRDFLYNMLNMELTNYYNFTTESYLIRPMITWKINDMLTAKTGCSYMTGPENSIFDYSAPVLNHFVFSIQVNFD